MINKKAEEFASLIKNTNEFKNMARAKLEIDNNRNLRKQLNNYLDSKKNLFSRYSSYEAKEKLIQLNTEYEDFFRNPKVSNYIETTKKFNDMMSNIYNIIEKKLVN